MLNGQTLLTKGNVVGERMNLTQTHMNWHVKIIRLEGVSHVSEGLQGVAPAGLLEAECHSRFAIFLNPKRKAQIK